MRPGNRLEPGFHSQLVEDVANVVAHSVFRDIELLGNLPRSLALPDQCQDLQLPTGQFGTAGRGDAVMTEKIA